MDKKICKEINNEIFEYDCDACDDLKTCNSDISKGPNRLKRITNIILILLITFLIIFLIK